MHSTPGSGEADTRRVASFPALEDYLLHNRAKMVAVARKYLAPLRVGRAEEAEDCVQDAILKAYRYQHSYDPQRSIEGWFRSVVIRFCLDRTETQARRQTASLDEMTEYERDHYYATVPSAEDTLLESLDFDANIAWIEEALARLPEKEQRLLRTAYLEENTRAEAAQEIGCTRRKLRNRLCDARKHLRDEMEATR